LGAALIASQLHRFLVTAHSALQFNLRIRNESGPLPWGIHIGTDGGTMLMRGIGAVALTLSLSSEALAERGFMQRVSCAMVRVYVAKYSASAAEMWARSHGATDAQIEAARQCLKGTGEQAAQVARWSTR
jgi:hypothetical protein